MYEKNTKHYFCFNDKKNLILQVSIIFGTVWMLIDRARLQGKLQMR